MSRSPQSESPPAAAQKTVVLADLVDALNSLSEMAVAYLDRETGEIHCLTEDDLAAAERARGDLAGWEHERVDLVREIRGDEAGRYAALPDKEEIHEYRFLEDFAYAYPDEVVSEDLSEAIRGRGAFRRFKEAVHRLGLTEEWYEYRHQRLLEVAEEWCESNDIPFVKGRPASPEPD